MKRKIYAAALLFVLIMTFASCGGKGDISTAGHKMDESEIYTEAEIMDAMDTVTSYFKKNYAGCKLTNIEYDEEKSVSQADGWAEQYEADEAIVLISSFDVDSSGGDGSLNPDSTYNGWQWVLTRNDGGKWKLQTWGY